MKDQHTIRQPRDWLQSLKHVQTSENNKNNNNMGNILSEEVISSCNNCNSINTVYEWNTSAALAQLILEKNTSIDSPVRCF